jgi:hypothetical protein
MTAPHRAFDLALDEALDLLASGVSREDCLQRFPQYRAELEPLLMMAEAARAGLLAGQPLPRPNLARGKRRFLDAARAASSKPMLWGWGWRLASVTLALVFVLAVTGLASANALPGDVLYPVKRGLENMQLALTLDAEARAHLQAEHAARRRAEAQDLAALNREVELEFTGIVESVSPSRLVISGLSVQADDAQAFLVLDEVRVLARVVGGDIIADRITLVSRPTPTATLTSTPTGAPSAIPTATTTPSPPTLTLESTRLVSSPTIPASTLTRAPEPTRPAHSTPSVTPPATLRAEPTATEARPTEGPTERPTEAPPSATPASTPTHRPTERPTHPPTTEAPPTATEHHRTATPTATPTEHRP